MSVKITKTENFELESLKKEVNGSKEYRILIKELMKYGKIKSEEFNVLKAGKALVEGEEISYMVMGMNDSKVNVIYSKSKNKEHVFSSIIESDADGKEILNGFKVENGEIRNLLTKELDENFRAAAEELDKSIVHSQEKTGKVEASDNCLIYGNWCGPGCSGPSAPISPVDACCKEHDLCYGRQGYLACSCDRNLKSCLLPYVAQGSEYAIIVFTWFNNIQTICNPFK